MTPFAHLTNEQLIALAYKSITATPLELEFAFRMDNHYADGVAVQPDEPAVPAYKDAKLVTNT